MHQALHISEILLNIFGRCRHCSGLCAYEGRPCNCGLSDLAALARTCCTFKEPALDVLWEVLINTSPLARCLPEACILTSTGDEWWRKFDPPCYTFSRALKEEEWRTLRSYARRIRFICGDLDRLPVDTLKELFLHAPFDDGPLFPHLRSLHWNGKATTFTPLHLPSLTTLHITVCPYIPTNNEIFGAYADRCSHVENFEVTADYPIADKPTNLGPATSYAICRWPKLRKVVCPGVVLGMDAILHLSSVPSLTQLEFAMKRGTLQEISHLDSKLVFSNLTNLTVKSICLDLITSLLRNTQLPAVETFHVTTGRYTSTHVIQSFLAAIREACLPRVLAYLEVHGSMWWHPDEAPSYVEGPPCLTIDDLRPCTIFSELRGLDIDFDCSVYLTDDDLLELMSPRMEYFRINRMSGWHRWQAHRGGVTLSGLVQLLRQCPLLEDLSLTIDTQTFVEIPEGLDISFPPRRHLKINLLDSYILSQFATGLVSVFTAIGLRYSMLTACKGECVQTFMTLWRSVLYAVAWAEELNEARRSRDRFLSLSFILADHLSSETTDTTM